METDQASRRLVALRVLLVAVTVSGINSVGLAAESLLGKYQMLEHLDELGGTSTDLDIARDFVISDAWGQVPVLVVGLLMAILGAFSLRNRLEHLTWRHVVMGAAVAVLLTWALAVISAALIGQFDLEPSIDQYQ